MLGPTRSFKWIIHWIGYSVVADSDETDVWSPCRPMRDSCQFDFVVCFYFSKTYIYLDLFGLVSA